MPNDEDQAKDDLSLIAKLREANPSIRHETEALAKAIRRKDGAGELQVLPARDAIGAHGKTFLFCGFDEFHGHRNRRTKALIE